MTLAYLVQLSGFSIFMFAFKLRKIQIIPTKYPKLVIKLLWHILGYYIIHIKMFDGVIPTLGDIGHVPDLKRNLISLSTLDAKSTSTLVKVEF